MDAPLATRSGSGLSETARAMSSPGSRTASDKASAAAVGARRARSGWPELPCVLSRRPARRSKVDAAKVQRSRLQIAGQCVVPAVQPTEERDHGNELDNAALAKMRSQSVEVLPGGRIRSPTGSKCKGDCRALRQRINCAG